MKTQATSPLDPDPLSCDLNSALPPRKLAHSEASEASEASESGARVAFGEGAGSTRETGAAAAALDAITAAYSSEASSSSEPLAGAAADGAADPDLIDARIVATSNQLEEEPWLPVRNIVTMYRIHATAGANKSWEVLRRYSDFAELHLRLSRAVDPTLLPALPPKLMLNDDAAIAERYLELDTYLRKLLTCPATAKHARLFDFLGAEKHGVRYGMRRYEYDSAQSEGNKFIRDDAL